MCGTDVFLDYLETLEWDKAPPAPVLPESITLKNTSKYIEACENLTGIRLS